MRKALGINYSFWELNSTFHPRDIVVVGAGIVGLSTAIEYKTRHPNSEVLVIERGALATGASTRNAGFACFGSISELIDDTKTMSDKEIVALINKRWEGLEILRDRVGDDNMEYHSFGGYEVFSKDDEDMADICFAQIDKWNSLLQSELGLEKVYSKISTKFGFNAYPFYIKNQYEGQLHPGKMMKGLRRKCNELNIDVLYNTELKQYVDNMNGVELWLGNNVKMHCGKLVIATNAFAKNMFSELDIVPARNQVLMTKPINKPSFKGTFHYDKGYIYFRNYKNRLLIGGGRNTSSKELTSTFGLTDEIQNNIRRIVSEMILPDMDWQEDIWWSGIIATGDSKKPIVKKVSCHVYVALRLGGMGVALGSMVGNEVANLAARE